MAFPTLAIAAVGAAGKSVRLDGEALRDSLKTGTMAMMLMTLWFLLPKGNIDPAIAVLGIASFGLSAFTKISPLWLIFGAGAANLALKLILGA